jgi:hypothetical protein
MGKMRRNQMNETIATLETMKPTELAQFYVLAVRYPNFFVVTPYEIQVALEANVGDEEAIQMIKYVCMTHNLS